MTPGRPTPRAWSSPWRAATGRACSSWTPAEAYISFLYLAPEQRNNGVGIQLIGKAVSLSRPLDCDKLGLVCSEQNAHALAFYQKYGFHTIGTEAGAYGTLYRMQKDIGYTVREDLM